MSKLKYLSKNIALFTVSNFVSKILVFLLVPFYTNILTTYEYGIVDILQVTLLLLVPAITINIGEAALRYGIERSDKRPAIFNIGIKYILRAQIAVLLVCIISMFFVNSEIRTYLIAFIFLFASNAVFEFMILFFQGSELVPIVVIGSVSCTAFTIGFNLIFLLVIKLGIYGYILSQVLAYTISAFIMILLGRKAEVIKGTITDKNLENEMLTYSKPMIVYSTASWVNNAVDRYFVAFICGAAVNGIYGVAYKIPAILMVFQRIFAQAWQMSATKSYGDENSNEFFSMMYRGYNAFMVLGCSALVLIVRPLAQFLFRKDFYDAWRLVPPLLISVIFGALTGFLGSICLAHKDSKAMGKATGIGALINVVLNLLFIPKFGAMGAAVATAVSYFVMSFLAYLFVKKYVLLKVDMTRFLISYVVVVIESVIMIFGVKYDLAICTLLLIALIGIYVSEVKELLSILIQKITKRID